MFLCLLTLLLLPFMCSIATWLGNEEIPYMVRSRVQKVVSFFAPFVMEMTLVVLRFVDSFRSNYVWEKRMDYPRAVRKIVDACLFVQSSDATLSVSSGHESIRVEEAIVTHNGTDYDVKDMLGMIWLLGNGDRAVFSLHRILAYENIIVSRESEVSLRVRYTGHANIKKRSPAQTYSARYTGSLWNTARFPPYPASEPVKKGLGVIKVVSAIRKGGVQCTNEARESAGLRGKFYVDVSDTDTLVNNVVNFLGESDRIYEDMNIRVTTSKGVKEFN